ncbi:hypothetical protein T235_13860 [Tannerella sp. oral taxon BU063 isolate Cell 8/11]|uniref:Uncharacterized protein n=1 Tax=Tannerella sp. oral taxon BU063 isolate Cell 8/11 TaxID=1411915 RepID=W2CYW4_9BACT|nr:hypothetical protein T235_13860 [Tannerella sp. oral taxon BU063 isolate Cell 8/11]
MGATERHARPLERALGAAWAQSPPSENILQAAGIYTLLLENISPASGTRKPPSENILRAAGIYTLLLENISPASGTRKPSSEILLWAAGTRALPAEIPMGTADRRALLSENIGATRAGR